jgi:hypothetical protein
VQGRRRIARVCSSARLYSTPTLYSLFKWKMWLSIYKFNKKNVPPTLHRDPTRLVVNIKAEANLAKQLNASNTTGSRASINGTEAAVKTATDNYTASNKLSSTYQVGMRPAKVKKELFLIKWTSTYSIMAEVVTYGYVRRTWASSYKTVTPRDYILCVSSVGTGPSTSYVSVRYQEELNNVLCNQLCWLFLLPEGKGGITYNDSCVSLSRQLQAEAAGWDLRTQHHRLFQPYLTVVGIAEAVGCEDRRNILFTGY